MTLLAGFTETAGGLAPSPWVLPHDPVRGLKVWYDDATEQLVVGADAAGEGLGACALDSTGAACDTDLWFAPEAELIVTGSGKRPRRVRRPVLCGKSGGCAAGTGAYAGWISHRGVIDMSQATLVAAGVIPAGADPLDHVATVLARYCEASAGTCLNDETLKLIQVFEPWQEISTLIFTDPNPTFAARADVISTEGATDVDIGSGTQHRPAYNSQAALYENVSITNVNANFEDYISTLEANHPIGGSGFESFPWMALYARWKDSGLLDATKFDRFRTQMLRFDSKDELDPITAAGSTQNQQWMKAAAGVLIGEEWPGGSAVADNAYAYLRDTWLPTIGQRYFQQGWHEYNSPNYLLIYMACFEVIRRYSTNAGIRSIVQFVQEQAMISWAHSFALNQFAAATLRSPLNFYGTPAYPQGGEHLWWLLFGGETPHTVFSGTGGRAWEEFTTAMPIISSSTFAVPSLAWRINQAAHQQTHTFKEKARPEPHEPAVRPNHEWPVIETYTRAPKRYAVSTTHWPNGMDLASVSSGLHHEQDIPWLVTWSSTGSSMSQFRVGHNDNASYFQDGAPNWARPIAATVHCTTFGSLGVVVEVYNIASGQTDGFIQGFEPDQVQASSTSGNWRFLHMPNVLIACYFTAGFAVQSAKNPILHSGDAPELSQPWYRAPASGTNLKQGVVVETAAPEDYVGGDAATRLSNFQSAITASRGGFAGGVDASQIGAAQPQITYYALNGKTYVCQFMGTKSIDGVPFDWNNANRLESPWVAQDYDGDDMLVTDPGTGQVTRYRWSDKSITAL